MLCGLIERECMQISYWELFSDISKWFRECLSDFNTTSYRVSSIVNVCISHAILWTQTGNPLIIKCEISSSVNHMWQNISRLVTKGDSYHNTMKFLQDCLSHIAKWLPHTHLLLDSSHVIWHISVGYRRGVIPKYDNIDSAYLTL